MEVIGVCESPLLPSGAPETWLFTTHGFERSAPPFLSPKSAAAKQVLSVETNCQVIDYLSRKLRMDNQ